MDAPQVGHAQTKCGKVTKKMWKHNKKWKTKQKMWESKAPKYEKGILRILVRFIFFVRLHFLIRGPQGPPSNRRLCAERIGNEPQTLPWEPLGPGTRAQQLTSRIFF